MRYPAIEIAVQDPVGAAQAAHAGADRIELCVGLSATGGLTPTIGNIQACSTIISTHVLIRVRPGGFVYSEAEIEVMATDISQAVSAGADGVVIGAARSDGTLDIPALRYLIDHAHGAEVTLHRVFDTVPSRIGACHSIKDLGIKRILSSGGQSSAPAGAQELAMLVAHVPEIEIMAGGGIRPDNIDALATTGVAAIHSSASTFVERGPAGPGGGAAPVQVTDEQAIRALVSKVQSWC
ncbi:copper homeostasis protein CutC [Corynebacterium sp. ES2794-CONJ1]|uniref:copper homeostasis protein CutC n=1 Tax=Corynebacterium sp. ES2794-CONJ1 TaxID=2980553 RepID=UPI0021DA44AB|nr:copper homeostasis protein CutC [Corynebacterium sp. ES2794-CONJ1]MCU9518555.1 copper homeostasis protein CutC [Corynebacterium sp. ES2794-CONJ1]